MSKIGEVVKKSFVYGAMAALILGVAALALAVPVLTIYGLCGVATGSGVGISLIAGPTIWAIGSIGSKKSPAAPGMNNLIVALDDQTDSTLSQKTLAPDFNLDAAVTLGKKITVGPAIQLKSNSNDPG